jgi:hypothetical protein
MYRAMAPKELLAAPGSPAGSPRGGAKGKGWDGYEGKGDFNGKGTGMGKGGKGKGKGKGKGVMDFGGVAVVALRNVPLAAEDADLQRFFAEGRKGEGALEVCGVLFCRQSGIKTGECLVAFPSKGAGKEAMRRKHKGRMGWVEGARDRPIELYEAREAAVWEQLQSHIEQQQMIGKGKRNGEGKGKGKGGYGKGKGKGKGKGWEGKGNGWECKGKGMGKGMGW